MKHRRQLNIFVYSILVHFASSISALVALYHLFQNQICMYKYMFVHESDCQHLSFVSVQAAVCAYLMLAISNEMFFFPLAWMQTEFIWIEMDFVQKWTWNAFEKAFFIWIFKRIFANKKKNNQKKNVWKSTKANSVVG